MPKLKRKMPPLYIPSSGSIVSVKFSVSSGFGKVSFIVLGRESSERSGRGMLAEAWRQRRSGLKKYAVM